MRPSPQTIDLAQTINKENEEIKPNISVVISENSTTVTLPKDQEDRREIRIKQMKNYKVKILGVYRGKRVLRKYEANMYIIHKGKWYDERAYVNLVLR